MPNVPRGACGEAAARFHGQEALTNSLRALHHRVFCAVGGDGAPGSTTTRVPTETRW